jgi:hypothetical protein
MKTLLSLFWRFTTMAAMVEEDADGGRTVAYSPAGRRRQGTENVTANRRFGMAWVTFEVALLAHGTDEGTHDFLSTYNAIVRAIRAGLPILPLPTFSFRVRLVLLITGIFLLLCLSPFALRGITGLKIFSWPLSLVVGMLNATLHISSSVYFHRWMLGVYSSPLLLIAAIFLLASSRDQNSSVES